MSKKNNKPPVKQKYVKTPEDFLKLWEEYKQFIDDNPDVEEVVTVKGTVINRNIKRPYIRQGFEAYIYNKYRVTLRHYFDNDDNSYDSYRVIIAHTRSECYDDHVSGSITGRYKAPNLVARIHGLSEKNENRLTDKEGNDVSFDITLNLK